MYKQIIGEFLNSDASQIIGKHDFQNDIITTFSDFFENKDNLSRFSDDYLIQDYISYKRNNLHLYKNALLEVHTLLQAAKTASSDDTYGGLAYFQPVSVEMGNKHWSMVKLQNDFDLLAPYEYITECFRLIEHTSENLLKNLFALLVYLIRVEKGKKPNYEEITKIKFGSLLNEIVQSNRLQTVLGIIPSTISVSQWRNISCHKSYQFVNGKVNCQYGDKLQFNITIPTKEELLCIAKSIYLVAQIILLPIKLFLYDNIEQIRRKMDALSLDSANFRDEDWELIFVTELLANGLVVVEIKNAEKLCITVQDTQAGKINDRIILIPLAAYKAWVLTDKDEVEITYVQSNGNPYATISLSSDVCKKVSSYEKEFSYLAEKMIVRRL